MLDCQIDDNGIATLTLDMPDRSMNVINKAVFDAIVQQIDAHAANPDVKGFIVTSGKPAFAAGADVSELDRLGDPDVPVERIYELSDIAAAAHRRLETCGKPVVAAINGTALGGGYELCLAAHRRIVADDPKIQIGLPEVALGLLPGGGGTQRLARMLGIKPALDLLIDGTRLAPAAALAAGLVDEVVPAGDLLAAARRWLSGADARAVQPWDDPA